MTGHLHTGLNYSLENQEMTGLRQRASKSHDVCIEVQYTYVNQTQLKLQEQNAINLGYYLPSCCLHWDH
jgi:N-acetyl-beta-hexosaminidase